MGLNPKFLMETHGDFCIHLCVLCFQERTQLSEIILVWISAHRERFGNKLVKNLARLRSL